MRAENRFSLSASRSRDFFREQPKQQGVAVFWRTIGSFERDFLYAIASVSDGTFSLAESAFRHHRFKGNRPLSLSLCFPA
jgi:hypothetical protein